jgi:hypothetical protein
VRSRRWRCDLTAEHERLQARHVHGASIETEPTDDIGYPQRLCATFLGSSPVLATEGEAEARPDLAQMRGKEIDVAIRDRSFTLAISRGRDRGLSR